MLTAQIDTSTVLTAKTGLAVADLDDDPPVQANMVALGYGLQRGPLALEAVIDGEDATPRTLSGAYWFGWHAKLDKAVAIAKVNGGFAVEVSTTKAFAEVLEMTAGVYTHVGLGKGTLSAGTAALRIYPLELNE